MSICLSIGAAFIALFGSFHAFGQCTNLCLKLVTCPSGGTTSISGTVFAPNGTDPLPNVLVYVPNATVQPFAPGVPNGPVPVSGSPLVSTITAFDGTFKINDMPVASNVPLVIQAGKWRRQFVIQNVARCVNTALPTSGVNQIRFPQNASEGDIPKIAVSTGSVDAVECVLRKIGIADTEFSDPPAQNGNGRVNLYLGEGSAGAQYSANTPSATQLWGTTNALNQYDLVMFPCQGSEYDKTAAEQVNITQFANAGGRIFTTHYSYVWLNTNTAFSGLLNWDIGQTNISQDPQTGLVNESGNFSTEGQQLAQWLQRVGATTVQGQIPLNTLRHDFNGVVAPTELWLYLMDPMAGTIPMQATFNTPVNTQPTMQYGKVLFNDYHVENGTFSSITFPAECTSPTFSPQEKLLEFSLFDLTGFLTSFKPTVLLSFANNPTSFTGGDPSDTISITILNTSPVNADSTLSVTVVLPTGLSLVSMQDASPSGGWNCSGLTCTRTTPLQSNLLDTITLTVSVAPNAGPSVTVSATVSGGGLAASVMGNDQITVNAPVLVPTTITKVQGDNQSVPAGQSAIANLEVQVFDQFGNPDSGSKVTFAAVTGGGGSSGTFAGTPTQPITTGADGTATAPMLTANTISGPFSVTASVASTSLTTTFHINTLGPTYIPLFTDNSGDIGPSALYQPGAEVGMETLPLDYFHVGFLDTSGGVTGYAVQNLAGGMSSYSGMLFYDQNGLLVQFQGFNNSTHEYRINNIAPNGSINFMLGSSKFQVRSDGDINIAGNLRKGGSLFLNNNGVQNTAIGSSALGPNTGSNDTAAGFQALISNTSGSSNTAIGAQALGENMTGNSNTAVGASAGMNSLAGTNIFIANPGGSTDTGTIRIGNGNDTGIFIAGISGTQTVKNDALAVVIDTNAQLGTVSSSRRFKIDIQDMGDRSSGLFELRPVTFRYRQQPLSWLEYGFIAEEVADIYPDLVVNGPDGQIETLQYDKLTPMLLNEYQKLHFETEDQMRELKEVLRSQEERSRKLEDRVAALEAATGGKEK